ncbi:MAG: hypothetical protein V4713_05685 [Pseudomonadota bacterium]
MNMHALRRHSDPSHHHDNDILLEVDFKWLMAGIGYWIDFVKLRNDPVYANNCLQCALKSDCEPLRRCALEIRDELDNAQ